MASYMRARSVSVSRQVFLGEAPPEAVVSDALEALRGGADPADIGVPAMLPPALADAGPREIGRGFGAEFAAGISDAAVDGWVGPVRSGYGVHLVRVTAHTPSAPGRFDEVRDQVEVDWRRQRVERLMADQLARLREGYVIRISEAGPTGEKAE